MSKPSKQNGRSSPYDKAIHPDWAWGLAIQGKTDNEIANAMGISRSTLSKWKKEHEEFREAISSGKDPADSKVERSLYHRCCGYAYTERRIISTIDPRNGKPSIERIETTERFVPPDTTAMIYWLKNRRRDKWKDKWDVELNNQRDVTLVISPASHKPKEVGEDE